MKASDEITEEQSREVHSEPSFWPLFATTPIYLLTPSPIFTFLMQMLFDIESAYQEFFAALK
jgi:hypothetical protein